MTKAIDELCALVAEAGGQMRLYGKPVTATELDAHCSLVAEKRIASFVPTAVAIPTASKTGGHERRTITIEVLGTPAPKGSSRAMIRDGHAVNVPSGSVANMHALRSWDVAVREAARAAIGDGAMPAFVQVPIRISIYFRMRRPAGHYRKDGMLKLNAPRWCMTKPDVSKLARSTEDALTGIVFDDDARIADESVTKQYANKGDEGATIVVEELQ